MVIKVYTSGISGNKEVKKKQQRIMMILESKNVTYVTVDITEPGNEEEKSFMQENAKPKDSSKHPIPPQIFNDTDYCGDYDGFDLANENDELETFLKMPLPPSPPVVNGNHEHSTEKDTSDSQVVERQEELINSMVPKTALKEEPVKEVEENIHGFCYTPGLAKRLEKALKDRIHKAKPTPTDVNNKSEDQEDETETQANEEMEAEEENNAEDEDKDNSEDVTDEE